MVNHDDKFAPCDHCGSRRHHHSRCPNEASKGCLKFLFKALWKLKLLILLGIIGWLGYRWISLGESPIDVWNNIQEWWDSLPEQQPTNGAPSRAVPVEE